MILRHDVFHPTSEAVSQNSLFSVTEYPSANCLSFLQRITQQRCWWPLPFIAWDELQERLYQVLGPKSDRIHNQCYSQHLAQWHLLNHCCGSDSSCLTCGQFWQGFTESVMSRALVDRVLVVRHLHLHCLAVIATSHCFLSLATWQLSLHSHSCSCCTPQSCPQCIYCVGAF